MMDDNELIFDAALTAKVRKERPGYCPKGYEGRVVSLARLNEALAQGWEQYTKPSGIPTGYLFVVRETQTGPMSVVIEQPAPLPVAIQTVWWKLLLFRVLIPLLTGGVAGFFLSRYWLHS